MIQRVSQTKQLKKQGETVGFKTSGIMISILTCMVLWLAEPENKTLTMNYSQRLKTLLPGFEGEGYPTREDIEEVKNFLQHPLR